MKIRIIAPAIFLGTFALHQIFGSGVDSWQDWLLGAVSVIAVYEISKAIRH